MKFKKMIIYSILSCLVVSCVGCNKNNSQQTQVGLSELVTEETTIATTTTKLTTITTKKEITMQERLENSTWVGCDGTGAIFSMQLTDDEIVTHTITNMGYQVDVEGYWELDEDNEKIIVYSDEELTDRVTYYDYIPINLQNDDVLLAMEGMYVSVVNDNPELSEADDEIATNYNVLTSSIENSSYWVALDDINADFLTRNYSDMYLYMTNQSNNDNQDTTSITTTTAYHYNNNYSDDDVTDITTDDEYSNNTDTSEYSNEDNSTDDNSTSFDGSWGLTYDYIYIKDNSTDDLVAFKWNFDAYTSVLSFTTTDDITIKFTLSDATSFDDALDIVQSHLNGDTLEVTTTNQEDITTEDTTTTTYWGQTSSETDTSYTYWEQTSTNTTFDYYNYIQTTIDPNVDNPNYDDSADFYDNYVPVITNSYALPITTTYGYNNNYNYSTTYDNNNYSTQAYGFE